MAADVCSEISTLVLVSPRISFSYDLNQSDTVPADSLHRLPDSLPLDSAPDFNFSVAHNTLLQQLSSADELFSNGKILPTQIKKLTPTKEIHQSHQIDTTKSENTNEDSKKKRLKEFLFEHREEEGTEKPSSKSFWQFRRSSSLNCDNGRSKGFIRSLQSLSRSNSTGSALNQKETTMPKICRKQNLQKEPTFMRSNSSVSSGSYYFYDTSKRPPLKNNCKAYGTGIRISPVLNISHGTVGLFGFGSLFCNGKSKKKRK